MYAVIKASGKQHRVAENDRLVLDRLPGEPGSVVQFSDVLMIAPDGAEPLVGTSVPSEARVFAQVVSHPRGEKVLVFKKKRRKNHRRLNGHRSDLTVVRITGISPTGEAPMEAAASESVAVEPAIVEAEAAPAPALIEE